MTKFADNEDNEDIYGQRLVKVEKVCLQCKTLQFRISELEAELDYIKNLWNSQNA